VIVARITRHPGRVLAALAVICWALRVALVFAGGQLYWPDEDRYLQSREMVADLAAGRIVPPLLRLSTPDHPLFKVMAMPAAYVERRLGDDTHIPGIYLSGISALAVLFVGVIALRLGSPPQEALLAALLAAASTTLFYYARHLVPYDAAMTVALGGLAVAVGRRTTAWSSWGCGVLAGCAFLTYTGYWTLAALVVLTHAFVAPDRLTAIRRGVLAAAGLVTPVASIVAITAPFGGQLIANFRGFSSNVIQGEFAEGWRLPFEYFWYAEHGMLVLWAAGTAGCILAGRRMSPTARVALLGLGFLYGALAITSTVLHMFVVYGRLARQLVPFFCLATAVTCWSGWQRLGAGARRVFAAALTAFVFVQAGVNFAAAFRVWFPTEFVREGRTDPRVGPYRDELVGIYTHHIYPRPLYEPLPKRFTVLRQAPHPLRFRPYQYEGYTPAERQALRSHDIAMKLLMLPPEDLERH
jgi:hypothetical protein